jgi:hypothetical protein
LKHNAKKKLLTIAFFDEFGTILVEREREREREREIEREREREKERERER